MKLNKLIKLDLEAANFRNLPAKHFHSYVLAFLLNPGFKSLVIYRIQAKVHGRGTSSLRTVFAFLISSLNHSLTGAEFIPGCEIGPGAVVRHPSGIVVGSGVKIGARPIFQHGVTIGMKDISGTNADDGYPSLGDGVKMGTHAVIIGKIKVGDNVVVGANSVVSKDVEEGLTVIANKKATSKR